MPALFSHLLQSKYFYLLMSLLCYFLVSPFLIHNLLSNALLSIFVSSVIVFCINVINRNRVLLIASLILGSIALISHWITSLGGIHQSILLIHYISILIFLIIMMCFVITSVAQHTKITKDTLLGAICGYLLIGLTWAQVYSLIHCLDPSCFSFHTSILSMRDLSQHMIYFSFETITTLGYGDILPLTDVVRTLAWLEAAFGQIYIAVWVSQLVGLRIAQLVTAQRSQPL